MKTSVKVAIILLLFICPYIYAQNTGEELFKSLCSSCHTIGQGRLVGPDLTGVYDKRSSDWLISFIRSSQTMIREGDPDAVAIYNEYNKIPMPDNQLSDEQILSIIDHIREADQASQETKEPAVVIAETDTAPAAADTTEIVYAIETVSYGDSLFHGTAPFAGGASPCISCHHIMGRNFLGGGMLAIDLNQSYTKLGQAGVQAILVNPPFPVMKAAMPGKLTDEEIQALTALLKTINDSYAAHPFNPKGGLSFFIISFVIAILLVAHIYVFYDNRKIPDASPGAETIQGT